MDRDDLDRELSRLRDATADVAPDERFTSAIVAAATSAGPGADPLADIARRTSALDPGDAFSDAVMERAARAGVRRRRRDGASWLDGVVRTGPFAVGLAAALAAASFALFVSDQGELDEVIVASLDGVEVLE